MVQSETLCLQRLGKYKEEIQRGSPCASQEAHCFTSFKSSHLHSDPMRKEPLLSPPTDEQTGSERLLRVTRVVAGGSARLGPSPYHTLAQWEAGAQETAGLSARWFLTGSVESRSSFPIPCTPPNPVSGAEPGLLLLSSGWEAWVPVSVPPTPPRSIFRSGWRLGLEGRAWGREMRRQQLLWAGLWGGATRGCETCLGSCSQAKPQERPRKRGLPLSRGRSRACPGLGPQMGWGHRPFLSQGARVMGSKVHRPRA